jgi:DNA polymerase-3 subunit delta'
MPEGGVEYALALARQGVCEEEGAPGCPCRGCRLLALGNHPDVSVVRPDNTAIKIEQVRAIRLEAQKPPFMGRGRFFIFQSAHRMNASSSNALLKVLEEPPSATHFLLLTSQPYLLLPTLRSRCFRYALPDTLALAAAPENLARLWEEAEGEGSLVALEAFLKALAQFDYHEIPHILKHLAEARRRPVLAQAAYEYLQVLTSHPATFNRHLVLESILLERWAAGALVKALDFG